MNKRFYQSLLSLKYTNVYKEYNDGEDNNPKSNSDEDQDNFLCVYKGNV